MSLSRRGFIKSGICAGMARFAVPGGVLLGAAVGVPALANSDFVSSKSGTRLDQLINYIPPELDIYNPHTNETVKVKFFGPSGYDMSAISALNNIWRDWRQNSAPQINPRLFWGMAAVRASAMKDGHNGQITLLSGFRTRETTNYLRSRGVNAALNSQHMKAQAMDITLANIPANKIAGFVEWLQIGGTGYYPRNNFTHADCAEERQWRG